MERDLNHLKLLSVFYYIFGGLTIVFSLIFSIYIVMGVFMVADPSRFAGSSQDLSPETFGWILIAIGIVVIAMGLLMSVLYFFAGGSLRKQKRYTFALVIAGITCLSFPFGTTLGVFTIMVLMRDSVKLLFGRPVAVNTPSTS